MAAWIVPVLLTTVFIALFASAIPLIDEWVRRLDPRSLLAYLSFGRAAFWLFIACSVWPFVHMRRARRRVKIVPLVAPSGVGDLDLLFGEAAVLRSLILFNALFAVQTSLDVAYLWGGLALPDGSDNNRLRIDYPSQADSAFQHCRMVTVSYRALDEIAENKRTHQANNIGDGSVRMCSWHSKSVRRSIDLQPIKEASCCGKRTLSKSALGRNR